MFDLNFCQSKPAQKCPRLVNSADVVSCYDDRTWALRPDFQVQVGQSSDFEQVEVTFRKIEIYALIPRVYVISLDFAFKFALKT
jgi:hypothetical protein